jgi:hypothetical protein
MKITRILTHRFALSFFNLLVLAASASTLTEAVRLLLDQINNPAEMELILDGIAIIYIALGVALEERDSLMKFFGLYPKCFSNQEEIVDRNCHFYGLLILIAGLLMEMSVELVKIPNRVLNTEGIESLVFGAGTLFGLCAVYLLIRLTYLLIINKQGVYK